jgi:hypothetical protein
MALDKREGFGFGTPAQPGRICAWGAAIAFFPSDLRERAMLGDTGSNVLGAALGYGMLQLAPAWRVAVLAALVWLTLVSERRSFGEIIEGSKLLRFLDGLGRGEPVKAILIALYRGRKLPMLRRNWHEG